MGEAHNVQPNSNDQQQFRLNEINEVTDYFIAEIRKREVMSKRLSKHIASFDCFDESLIFYIWNKQQFSIVSFATVIGAPAGVASVSFNLHF